LTRGKQRKVGKRWEKSGEKKIIVAGELSKRMTNSESWASRCAESTNREKREIEKKYGIRIGQTDIYCARCNKPWGFGSHTCIDLRFEKIREEKRKRISDLKEAKNEAYDIIKSLGPKKVSIYLMIPEETVTKWIQRGIVPPRHLGKILNLEKPV